MKKNSYFRHDGYGTIRVPQGHLVGKNRLRAQPSEGAFGHFLDAPSPLHEIRVVFDSADHNPDSVFNRESVDFVRPYFGSGPDCSSDMRRE